MSREHNKLLTWEELPALFPEFRDAERWLPLLRRHLQLVEEASGHTRVTAVAESEAVRRQYAESLELLRIALQHCSPELVVDVGSGGGYPGLVIAAVEPRMRVVLVEPLRKRARLLEEMAAQLGLDNVEVVAERAEDAGRGRLRDCAGLVTARAVAPLPELLEYTAPLAAPDGALALPKGSGLEEELAGAGAAMAALACELEAIVPMRPEVSETLRVVVVRKRAATPERYPRRAGVPGKRPIKG